MTLSRRTWLQTAAVSLCLPSLWISRTLGGETTFKMPAQASWSSAQRDGFGKAMRDFRRCRVPRNRREQLFEGLAYAVSQGHRDSQKIGQTAGEYLQQKYAEVPDWLKTVALVVQIIAALLTILLLFI